MDELKQIRGIKKDRKSRAYVTGLHSTPDGIKAANLLLKHIRKTRSKALFALVVFPDIDRLLSLGSFAAVKAAWPVMAKRIKKRLPANSLCTQTQFGLFVQVWDPKAVDRLTGGELQKLMHDLNRPVSLQALNQVQAFTIKSYAGYLIIKNNEDFPRDAEALLSRLAIAAMSANQAEEFLRAFSPSLRKMMTRQEHSISHLALAIQDKSLGLRFQPRFHVKNKALCGAHAKLVWHDPKYGVMTSRELEDSYRITGTLPAIIKFSIKGAISFLEQLQNHNLLTEEFRLAISVPFEIFQYRNFDLYTLFSGAIGQAKIDAKQFCLEFEGNPEFTSAQSGRAINCIRRLNSLGTYTCLSVDQSRTDLNMLSTGLATYMKCDLNNFGCLNLDAQKKQLSTIIAIAKNSQIRLIVGGIATNKHTELINSESIDIVEGDLFSEPLGESVFLNYFKYTKSAHQQNQVSQY